MLQNKPIKYASYNNNGKIYVDYQDGTFDNFKVVANG